MPADLSAEQAATATPGAKPPGLGPPPAAPARPSRRWRTIGSYALLTAGAIVVLFPIYVTVVNSLLVPDQLVQQPPPLFPTDPQWSHYATAWTSGQMSKYMTTSAIMTVIIVAGSSSPRPWPPTPSPSCASPSSAPSSSSA